VHRLPPKVSLNAKFPIRGFPPFSRPLVSLFRQGTQSPIAAWGLIGQDVIAKDATMPTSKVPSPTVTASAKKQRSLKTGASHPRSPGIRGAAAGTKTGRPAIAESPSDLIDARIRELDDWRGEMLSRLRALIKEADPGVTEEWKWRGTPVWSHHGIICTGETYRKVVKMTFAKGASLADPARLFNSSLDGNVRRAIDFHEGANVDVRALKALIRAAVVANKSSTRGKST